MIELTKTKRMVDILTAVNIKPTEYTVGRNSIHLNLNAQQLMYAVNAAPNNIHLSHGDTLEWLELIKYIPNGKN